MRIFRSIGAALALACSLIAAPMVFASERLPAVCEWALGCSVEAESARLTAELTYMHGVDGAVAVVDSSLRRDGHGWRQVAADEYRTDDPLPA